MTPNAVGSLDVVIAATDSAEAATRCAASAGARVIIAYDPQRVDGSCFPDGVLTVAGEPGADAHRLRRMGFSRSTAEIVVFTEDSCQPGPEWVKGWLDAFTDPQVSVATGPVEHETHASALDWAVFYCEYAPFLPDSSADLAPSRLAGNNFAVRRSLLSGSNADIHEADVLAMVRNEGGRARLARSATVTHHRRFSLRDAVRDRLRFGYQFGRHCARQASPISRVLRIVLGPAMLLSQVVRLAWTLSRKRRLDALFLHAGPLTLGLLTAWTVGEWLGWVMGGDRLASGPRDERADRTISRRSDHVESASLDCRFEPQSA